MHPALLPHRSSPNSANPANPVTRRMLHERTCDIALRAGRTAPYVTQEDYEQAKRELTGNPASLIVDTSIDDALRAQQQPTETAQAHSLEPSAAVNDRFSSPRTTTPQLFFPNFSPLSGST